MSTEIRKTWNSYTRHDGYIMGWERGDAGIRVTVMDQEGDPVTFEWRHPQEPVAGHKVSIIMPKNGVTTRRDRPVLVLNHDTGEVMRDRNAPPPRGTRPIMLALMIWVLGAMGLSCLIIANTYGLTMWSLTLLATAFVVWRLAIATKELRLDERAHTRIRDEESLCLEIMTSAWRLASNQVFELRRREIA